ncbi:MAG: response regulator, partial [Desulfobacula sp.]|nr:response regulator [Desulfobacula sp.]
YNPDLILLDMKMPKMDGYEASKKIKSQETSKNIPIIAVTASALKQDEEIIRQSCDSYLRKPVSQTTLIKNLMKFLAHSEKKKPLPPIDSNLDIVLPNADKLKALYEIALDGDMDEITAYLAELEKQDTKLELFCQQFRELALGYKDEKIVSLLKQYLSK